MKPRTGTFLGLPYDLTRPTLAKLKSRVWNAHDHRVLVPHAFGWGYTVNLRELLRRPGLLALLAVLGDLRLRSRRR